MKPETALTPALRISITSSNTVVIEVVDVFQITHVDVDDERDPEQWCLMQATVTEELHLQQTCQVRTTLHWPIVVLLPEALPFYRRCHLEQDYYVYSSGGARIWIAVRSRK